jgi:hypothetical protein
LAGGEDKSDEGDTDEAEKDRNKPKVAGKMVHQGIPFWVRSQRCMSAVKVDVGGGAESRLGPAARRATYAAAFVRGWGVSGKEAD